MKRAISWLVVAACLLGPHYAVAQAVTGTTVNASGTVTTGGIFQTAASANDYRRALDFVNICNIAGNCSATTDYCYLYIATSGTPASKVAAIPVPPGIEYLRSQGTVPGDAILATCDTTADKYYLGLQ